MSELNKNQIKFLRRFIQPVEFTDDKYPDNNDLTRQFVQSGYLTETRHTPPAKNIGEEWFPAHIKNVVLVTLSDAGLAVIENYDRDTQTVVEQKKSNKIGVVSLFLSIAALLVAALTFVFGVFI
jgi:hypothetical protein